MRIMCNRMAFLIDHTSPTPDPVALLPESDECDATEAPAGFYAVPKATLPKDRGNLCRQCDWRSTCQDPATDLLAPGHRCMSHAIRAIRDGKTYRRNDRCSVVFKRLPQSSSA